MYFKFKVQLKFMSNRNYSSIIVNYHTGLRWKDINLKLKNRKNKNCLEKRAAYWYIVTSLLRKPQATPHWRQFVQAFEIALFSIRSIQTH